MRIDGTTKIYLGGVEQVKIKQNGVVIWEKQQDNTDYFYIENTYQGQNTVSVTTVGSSSVYETSVEYSKDKSTWTTIQLTNGGTNTITLNQGEKVYFRNNSGRWNEHTSKYHKFTANQNHKAGGNVMSLLDYTNINTVNLKGNDFIYLFYEDSELTDITDLKFPATTLTSSCYQNLFVNCTSLVNVPSDLLPSTTLAASCYLNMFQNCSSLTTAPDLPATTLEKNCYRAMFFGCSSLTTAPDLPATTLADSCYRAMFSSCSSLNSVTTYANNISTSDCTLNWLSGVANSGNFYNLGSATYSSGVNGIPSGWTQYKCKLSNVVLANTTGTQYSVSANMEWASSLNWQTAEIQILDQGGGQPAYLDFGQSEVVNGVLTPSTLMDFIDTQQPQSYCEITLYDDQGNPVFYQSNIPYTIQ